LVVANGLRVSIRHSGCVTGKPEVTASFTNRYAYGVEDALRGRRLVMAAIRATRRQPSLGSERSGNLPSGKAAILDEDFIGACAGHGEDEVVLEGYAALRTAMAAGVSGAARRIGPLPDGPRVYVDKLTFRVVTHATSAE
jgi:hypothetical protein